MLGQANCGVKLWEGPCRGPVGLPRLLLYSSVLSLSQLFLLGQVKPCTFRLRTESHVCNTLEHAMEQGGEAKKSFLSAFGILKFPIKGI